MYFLVRTGLTTNDKTGKQELDKPEIVYHTEDMSAMESMLNYFVQEAKKPGFYPEGVNEVIQETDFKGYTYPGARILKTIVGTENATRIIVEFNILKRGTY